MQPSLYSQTLHVHLFPSVYCDALLIFPHNFCFALNCFFCLSVSLYIHLKTLYSAVCPGLLLRPKRLCNTETDAQTLNCIRKNFWGLQGNPLFTLDRVFTEFAILYRYWNIFGIITQELQVVIQCLGRYPYPGPYPLLARLFCYTILHNAVVISELPLLNL